MTVEYDSLEDVIEKMEDLFVEMDNEGLNPDALTTIGEAVHYLRKYHDTIKTPEVEHV